MSMSTCTACTSILMRTRTARTSILMRTRTARTSILMRTRTARTSIPIRTCTSVPMGTSSLVSLWVPVLVVSSPYEYLYASSLCGNYTRLGCIHYMTRYWNFTFHPILHPVLSPVLESGGSPGWPSPPAPSLSKVFLRGVCI
jgi:hypothetical protein